jgi:hypothetical protein
VPLFYTRDRETGWLYRLSGCSGSTAEVVTTSVVPTIAPALSRTDVRGSGFRREITAEAVTTNLRQEVD